MFNISEIVQSSFPDAEGNNIPAGLSEGSAEIAGLQGEHQHILVSMDAGIYNVRKAICGQTCITCNGVVNSFMVDNPFALAVGGSKQQTFYMQYNTGSQFNLNSKSRWSSSATTVATVSAGLVNGVSAGSSTILAQDNFTEPAYNSCAPSSSSCTVKTNGVSPSGSSSGTVQVRVPTKVIPIATTSQGPIVCSNGQGWNRIVTNQLQDQFGQAYPHAGITMADNINFGSTNQLNLVAETGSSVTDANGSWGDFYADCTPKCPSAGESDASQNWTYNSIPLAHVNTVIFKCTSVTIDGF
jgi:hypothetical protein